MFFKKKKAEPEKVTAVETPAATAESEGGQNLDLLYLKNVKVDGKAANKEEAIRMVGQMLVDTGYVDPSYVDGMVEREKTFSTYMGSGLALPHGVEAAKKAVKASGIAVVVFQDGVDWGGETAEIVVGIAGVGDEHLNILSNIAEVMMDDERVKDLYSKDAQKIYALLTAN
ncbi:MAG: PTS sugar transporter subunit IIA [Hespellia sp.]|nr:PTS sugar transporter subunit IIA [Hespellia sp.]